MQFSQEQSEVVFEHPGSQLKISCAVKAQFSVENGSFAVLKSKKSDKYTCQVSNSDKKRICHISSLTSNQFTKRGNRFCLKITQNTVTTILSGIFDSAGSVDKLEALIQSITNKKRTQWQSKEQLIPRKENSSPLNRAFSKPKENIPKPTPISKRMRQSLSNPVFTKNRTPLASLPQSTPPTPITDDIKITAIGGKKMSATPTSSFYGQTKVPKMMSPPDRFNNLSIKSTGSKFPAYSSTRFARVPRFKYEKKDEKETSPTDGVVGFANLGNTCYMNSILQCLLNIPNFYQELRNQNNIEIVSHESLYNRLCNLGVIKHNHEGTDVQRRCLQKVKQSISEAAKRFSGYAQHDAHEFLCQCLDQLKEDLSNELSKRKDEIQLPENELRMVFTCPIKENFETTVVHSIICLECNEKVIKTEEYHDFSLVIPDLDENLDMNSLTITNLLRLYFNDEYIEYTCDKCKGDQSTLSHRFQKLPRILVLHLKRYDSYDAKRSDQITIPKVLNISDQISSDTVSPKEFDFDKSVWQDKQQSGVKRKPSADIEDIPSSKTPKTTLSASSSKNNLKAGEMLAMAHRDSIRDEEMRKKAVDESFTKIKGPRKSLFPEDLNSKTEPEEVKFIPDNLTSVSDDEEAQLQKALELSMQEYENQQKIDMLLYAEEKPEPKEKVVTPKTETNTPFMNLSEPEFFVDYGKKQLYHLVGIVNHHGLNTASGHYTCDCYDFKSKQWRNYNDSSVKEIKEEELFTERKESAYIVFYMHSSCYEAIESRT